MSMQHPSDLIPRIQEGYILAQLFHWNVKSYDAHMISDQLIQYLHTFIDTYAETLIGMGIYTVNIPRISKVRINLSKLVDGFLKDVKQVRTMVGNSVLSNLLDEFTQHVLIIKARINLLHPQERVLI